MPRKIILDCDPGIDDVFAILLAHGNPEIDLVAITTVAGNQTLEKVTRNALVTATIAGITNVPIAAGATQPLIRPQLLAPQYHGDSGLEGAHLAEPTVALDHRHAVDLIIELVMASDPGEITLVPVGPLTNIALAMRREPEIVSRVAEVILMGGAYSTGNVTPTAEFNVIVDPEAASMVFRGAWKVTMIGLDLTNQATLSPDIMDRISAIDTLASSFLRDLFHPYQVAYHRLELMPDPPVHDPCAVALVIDPGIMELREAHVDVELSGAYTYGTTVTAFLDRSFLIDRANQQRTQVATRLDRDRFWDLMVDAIAAIGDTDQGSQSP
jgi:purine nucleosidase